MSRTKLPGDSSNSDSIFLFLPGLHFYQLNFTSLSLHTCSLMSLCLFIRKTEYVLSSRTRFWYGLNVSMSEKSVLKPSNAVIYYVIYLPPLSKYAVEARGRGETDPWFRNTPGSFTPVLTPVSSAQPLKLCTLSAKALADTAPVWVTLPSSDVLHHIPWQDHCIPKASLPNLCPAGTQGLGHGAKAPPSAPQGQRGFLCPTCHTPALSQSSKSQPSPSKPGKDLSDD